MGKSPKIFGTNTNIMLKDNLARKLSDRWPELKCSTLSKKTGIHEETIAQILKGSTKNPGIYTIAKLAEALECSVDELISHKPQKSQQYVDTLHKIEEVNPVLLKSCVETILSLTQTKPSLTFAQVMHSIVDAYTYSIGKKLNTVDRDFAVWLVDHS